MLMSPVIEDRVATARGLSELSPGPLLGPQASPGPLLRPLASPGPLLGPQESPGPLLKDRSIQASPGPLLTCAQEAFGMMRRSASMPTIRAF